MHRRLPLLLHMLLNFGPTLRSVTHRPRHLHLRAHSHIKDSMLDLLSQFDQVYMQAFLTLHPHL